MATDAAAVVLALGASYVASLRGGPRSTFGLHRAEILAALVERRGAAGGLRLPGLDAGIARLADPQPVDAGPMVAFAAVGLLANAVSLVVLNRSETGSLNLRGAANEVFADLVGSVLAVVAGMRDPDAGLGACRPGRVPRDRGADPAALAGAAPGVGRVLLEIAPKGLDLDDVRQHLLGDARRGRRPRPARLDDHQRHAQPLRPRHRDRAGAGRRAGVGRILDQLSECIAEHFDVRHATFQVEPVTHREHEDLGELH